jgi:hypothetical protein
MTTKKLSTQEGTKTASIRFEWERALLARGLPISTMAVALVLATYANSKTGVAWPSVGAMADSLKSTDRLVQRHLNDLESSGWIRRDLGGGSRTSTYWLVIPVLPEIPSPMSTLKTRVGGDTGITSVTDITSDARDTGVVTLVSVTGDTGVTQTSIEQTYEQIPLGTSAHKLGSSDPPQGVSIDMWNTVRPILIAVAASIGADGPRLTADWESMKARRELCREIAAIVASGKSHRAIVDYLTDGGYQTARKPGSVLFSRAKEYRQRLELSMSDLAPASSAPLIVRDAIAVLRDAFRANPDPESL